MTRREAAVSNFKQGYNCAQSLVLAFADILPVDREQLSKLASSFGGGMGRLREVCGAVSGMFMADWLKRIKPYTVSLYGYQREMIERNAGLYKIGDVLILQENCYSDKTGIINDNTGNGSFLEV